jgi:glycerol kinase
MTGGTTRQDLCQAMLEGIALRTAEVIAAMAELVPLSASLSIDGGLSRSTYFAQFLADATGRTVQRQGFDELTAFGCAALAARGLGVSLPFPDAGGTVFGPRGSARAWHDRFAAAVSRARGWR